MNDNLRNVQNHPYWITYDYSKLIDRLDHDIKMCELSDDDNIYIQRSSIKRYNYQPIREYYLADDIRLITPKANIERMKVNELKFELDYLNGDIRTNKTRNKKRKIRISDY